MATGTSPDRQCDALATALSAPDAHSLTIPDDWRTARLAFGPTKSSVATAVSPPGVAIAGICMNTGQNMKAIVHIGDFKTGSTSIQTLLMYNQGNLARQRALYRNPASNIGSNFEYLIAANIESETDIDFSNAVPLGLPNRNAQERMYETLKNQLQDDSTSPDFCKYLVSAEQIASQLHTSNQKEALHNFLLQFFDDVVYLIYIRCQEDILASEYSEHVRQSGTATLTDFVNHAMHWHNYDEMLTRWENTVGPERITVRLFDPGFLEDGDIISDYCKVVGLDLAKLDRPERENRALTAEAAELIRIMNETHPKFRPDRSMDHLAATLRRRLSRPGRSRGPASG
jgi:hypothetical protein